MGAELVWEPCSDTRLSAHRIAKKEGHFGRGEKSKRVTESAEHGRDWIDTSEVRRRLKLATAAGEGRARKCVDDEEGCGVWCGRGACQSTDFPGDPVVPQTTTTPVQTYLPIRKRHLLYSVCSIVMLRSCARRGLACGLRESFAFSCFDSNPTEKQTTIPKPPSMFSRENL